MLHWEGSSSCCRSVQSSCLLLAAKVTMPSIPKGPTGKPARTAWPDAIKSDDRHDCVPKPRGPCLPVSGCRHHKDKPRANVCLAGSTWRRNLTWSRWKEFRRTRSTADSRIRDPGPKVVRITEPQDLDQKTERYSKTLIARRWSGEKTEIQGYISQ